MNTEAKKILRPLFLWAFIEALIFWYAIEKILWSESGIDAEQIIILGLIAQGGQVLFEVPSSIIADQWSRKKTLILSSLFMLGATAATIVSQTFIGFMVTSILWAAYFSFQSGTTNAYIYDLLKSSSLEKQYRKGLSRYSSFQLAGLLVSSLFSSILVLGNNLLLPFWATIPLIILGIAMLSKMPETAIERTHKSNNGSKNHVSSAAKDVLKKRWLIAIFFGLAAVSAGRFLWYEYYQLYSLDKEVATTLFGVMLALIHIGNITGSEIAHRIKSPSRVLSLCLFLLTMSSIGLIFMNGSIAIMLLLVLCFLGSQAATIVFDENLQHETSSELRATTLSLAGLASRVLFAGAAVCIIVTGVSPVSITSTALVIFMGIALFIPVRKKLIAA